MELEAHAGLAGSANITYDANQAKKYIIRRLLVYVAIKYGYLAYTITLLALGITYLAFKNNLSVVAETCIQAWLQLGMLLMGVVIQVAVYWTGVANDMIRQAARARRLQIQAAWQRNHGKKRGRHFVVEKLTEQNSPGDSNASSQVQNAAIGPLGQSRNVSGAESYVEMTVVTGSAMNKTGETQRAEGALASPGRACAKTKNRLSATHFCAEPQPRVIGVEKLECKPGVNESNFDLRISSNRDRLFASAPPLRAKGRMQTFMSCDIAIVRGIFHEYIIIH